MHLKDERIGESSKFPKSWTLEIQFLNLHDAYKNKSFHI